MNQARVIYEALLEKLAVVWDERGKIGKRYLAQDEIGTPFCITVDYETFDEQTVTVRKRNDTSQERVAVSQLIAYLQDQM